MSTKRIKQQQQQQPYQRIDNTMRAFQVKWFGEFIIILCCWLAWNGLCDSTQVVPLNSFNHSTEVNQTRQAKWFPFYTVGRFLNIPCTGQNKLLGTCVLNGECRSYGGVSTGSCNSKAKHAVCCVYQQSCGATATENNTYFVNPNYPDLWNGANQMCSISVQPNENVCQLRIDLLDFSLAPPNGDGICSTDVISISGSASNVPALCGENAGQHLIADFSGSDPISIVIKSTATYTFGRHWNIRLSQITCDSGDRAPSGCLQYHRSSSGVIRSFNYASSPNSMVNSIGVEGSRQIANLNYGICIAASSGSCSITYSPLSSDPYAFSMTGDVGGVDTALLGSATLQQQTCNTDYVIISDPSQNGTLLTSGSDRFCGLGLRATTSNVKPFVLFVITDSNETLDIGNRGFALNYAQNSCPVISSK